MSKTIGKPENVIRLPDLQPLPEDVYCQRHIDVRISESEAKFLKRLTAALAGAHAVLPTGEAVNTPPKAVRWLLANA